MLRKASLGFFHTSAVARITGNNGLGASIRHYSDYQQNSPTWRAFENVKIDPKQEINLRLKIDELNQELEEHRNILEKKRNERHQLESALYKLQEPSALRERTRSRLDDLAKIFTSSLYDFTLKGKISGWVLLPQTGIDNHALQFIKPILDQSQIKYKIESRSGQGERSEYLLLNLPKQMQIRPIKLSTNNEECTLWVNNFVQNLQAAQQSAENKIKEDYQRLKSTLLDPIVQGHPQAFCKFDPAPEALKRFKQELSNMNIRVIQENGLIHTESLDNYSGPKI